MMDSLSRPLQDLRSAVQFNCDICDARHAADYSMCVYLLKMREYYRWEQGLGLENTLSPAAIGDWLRQREERWNALVESDFVPLPLPDGALDPFDSGSANARLLDQGLVYSAGYGRNANPHFVLARLQAHQVHDGYEVFYCAEELARDLAAPPAMALGTRIFLRSESIARMLWEKVQESDWHSPDSAMHQAMRHYGFDDNPSTALKQMHDDILPSILDHERGELQAGAQLGQDWERMLLDFRATRAEIMLRAARDLLADSLVTLPRLLENPTPGVMHFFASNMTAMRRHLFPAFQPAYQIWLQAQHIEHLRSLLPAAQTHWRDCCLDSLSAWRHGGAAARTDIEQLLEERRL